MKIALYHLGLLNWPVSRINLQRIMLVFFVEGHILLANTIMFITCNGISYIANIKKARDIFFYYQFTVTVPEYEIFTVDLILKPCNFCHYLLHADIDYSAVDSQTILGEYVLRIFHVCTDNYTS